MIVERFFDISVARELVNRVLDEHGISRPRKARARETSAPSAVVRAVADEHPDWRFSEIVTEAVRRGVNPNTARGALVRYRRAAKEGA